MNEDQLPVDIVLIWCVAVTVCLAVLKRCRVTIFHRAGLAELYRHEPLCEEDDKYKTSIEEFEKSAVTNFSWLWD